MYKLEPAPQQSHLLIDDDLIGLLMTIDDPFLFQLLPPDAVNRESCWYGFMCRTQHHRPDHAKKLNHVCRPTRGNP